MRILIKKTMTIKYNCICISTIMQLFASNLHCQDTLVFNNHINGIKAVNIGVNISGNLDRMGINGGKWHFIDSLDAPLGDNNYDYILDFKEGLAAVCLGTVIDVKPLKEIKHFTKEEKIILDEKSFSKENNDYKNSRTVTTITKYKTKTINETKTLIRNRKSFREGGKWGFIDITGKVIIDLSFEAVSSYSNGLAAVRKNGKWGFIDTIGNLVIPNIYYNFIDFQNKFTFVKTREESDYMSWIIIDRSGNRVTNRYYGSLSGIPKSKYNNNNSINYYWKEFIDDKMELTLYDSSGLFLVEDVKTQLRGYIDSFGKEIIPPIYVQISANKDGLFCALLPNREMGYLDKFGKVQIPFEFYIGSFAKYDYTLDKCEFKDGFAIVERGNKTGYISKDGKFILYCKKNKLYDKDGKLILKCGDCPNSYTNNRSMGSIYSMFKGFKKFKNGKAEICLDSEDYKTQNVYILDSVGNLIPSQGKCTLDYTYYHD
ncbi:MAG: WG repeat-containing protein [Saprospiraceae bacterium]|nr:WG repeat-containing protein [Saprospiraceae bacterium]